MANFTEEEIQQVFGKGIPVFGHETDRFCLDICGALIQRSKYGDRNSEYGWEIDHIKPISEGGCDNLSNLQPLQWQNNLSKSDGKNFNFCVIGSKKQNN